MERILHMVGLLNVLVLRLKSPNHLNPVYIGNNNKKKAFNYTFLIRDFDLDIHPTFLFLTSVWTLSSWGHWGETLRHTERNLTRIK